MDVLLTGTSKSVEKTRKIISSLYKEIDDMLMKWFQEDFVQVVPVYGTVLREKDFCSVRHH
jgi:hypothetical protein